MTELVVRVSLVLLAGSACLLAARRASSAVRHWICYLALAASLALPPLTLAIPAWEIAVPMAFGPPSAGADSTALSWTTVLALAAWAGGALLLLARLAHGVRAAHRLCRDASGSALLGWASMAAKVQQDLGLKTRVRVLVSSDIHVPFAWGFFRPVVVLPALAACWTPSHCRAVLIHEMAHLRRGDCWTGLVAEIARAAYWFHPLAWALVRQMRHEQEAACDDRVLACGARPSGYASLLLKTVRRMQPGPLATVPTFGIRLGLERRIQSLLQIGRSRQVVTSDHHFWLSAAALLVALPIAAARPLPQAAIESVPRPVMAEAVPAETAPPMVAASGPALIQPAPVQPAPAPPATQTAARRAPNPLLVANRGGNTARYSWSTLGLPGRGWGLALRCEFEITIGRPVSRSDD